MNNDKLIEICKEHVISSDIDVVICEPYIPYIPNDWNGILVLAESQNLSTRNSEYVEYLKSIPQNERFHRLKDPSNNGIGPWDDGSIKLAIESAFETNAEKSAVSNAVLWSRVDVYGRNKTPSSELINHSISIWIDYLQVIRPFQIVTCGKIANKVIRETSQKLDYSLEHTELRLPSRTAMSRISGMFPERDLLSRYPEVLRVINIHPEWLKGGYRHNKVFFACHAVSVVKQINVY